MLICLDYILQLYKIGATTLLYIFYEVFKENKISSRLKSVWSRNYFPSLSFQWSNRDDKTQLRKKKNNKCSSNPENESELELNIWRNPDYMAKEIGLTGNTCKEYGSSEHWDNCGDSKGKLWEYARWVGKYKREEWALM